MVPGVAGRTLHGGNSPGRFTPGNGWGYRIFAVGPRKSVPAKCEAGCRPSEMRSHDGIFCLLLYRPMQRSSLRVGRGHGPGRPTRVAPRVTGPSLWGRAFIFGPITQDSSSLSGGMTRKCACEPSRGNEPPLRATADRLPTRLGGKTGGMKWQPVRQPFVAPFQEEP